VNAMLALSDRPLMCDDINDWSVIIGNRFGGLSARCAQPETFSAQLAVKEFAQLSIASVRSSPAQIRHLGMYESSERDGRFIVKTQIRGESELSTDLGAFCMRPGDFVVCDTARPFRLSFNDETEIISIPVPARFLERFLPNPERVAFRPSSRDLAAHGVVSDYLQSLLRVRGLAVSPRQAAHLRDTYFELLVVALDTSPTARALSTAQAMHLERIKAFIDQTLDDEALTIEKIAQELGVSKRYLHTIFGAQGMSIWEYVISARLARAACLLRAERHAKVTVAEVAYSSGFRSVAHFTRCFKARYLETPTSYRERNSA
jgi:AraC-like DNA-binding protein